MDFATVWQESTSEGVAARLHQTCVWPILCVTVTPVVSSLVHLRVIRVDLYAFDISSHIFVWNI